MNKKYRDKDPFKNRIFTQHVRMGLDGRKHRRNLNTLVVGGSGAGKSRFYAKVNICQCNTSLFILDCKGELLRDCGGLLEQMGYEIKVVDLLNMEKSHCYNPFAYLKSDNDVQKMVTNLFKATTPKGSQSNDPFWDTAASMLLMALVFYLWYEAPEDEKNFPMIMEMLRAGEVREDDDSYQSPLDELFDRLEMRSPDHIAVKYYKDYRSGSAKTLKSIQITLASRLENSIFLRWRLLPPRMNWTFPAWARKSGTLCPHPGQRRQLQFLGKFAVCQHFPGTFLFCRPGTRR